MQSSLILPALSAITRILKPNQQFGQGMSKSRMVIGMLRSPGLPTVTVKPPVFDSHHGTSAHMRAAVATTSALNLMLQNSSAKVPRKLRIRPFKTVDEKNTIGDIMYRWEIGRAHV